MYESPESVCVCGCVVSGCFVELCAPDFSFVCVDSCVNVFVESVEVCVFWVLCTSFVSVLYESADVCGYGLCFRFDVSFWDVFFVCLCDEICESGV